LGRVKPGGDVDKLIAGLQRAQGATGTTEPASDPLAGLQFLDARAAGDVWALSQLWQSLCLDELALAWRRSRTQLDVLALFRAMVFNRLCDPQSNLGVLRWLDTVALPVGFGLDEDAPMHQHLLRAMDVIDEHHDALRDRMALDFPRCTRQLGPMIGRVTASSAQSHPAQALEAAPGDL
jgi:hypothetical protein